MEVMWCLAFLEQSSARQLRELDEDALPSSFLLKIERVKGDGRVFGTHTAAPTGGRGQTDAPTASPPPALLELDLHDR
jgi:hypothetical protein